MMPATIREAATQLRQGSVTCTQLITSTFSRIKALNPVLNMFLETREADALLEAHALDRQFKAGNPLPDLAGIPLAIKDLITVKDMHTTCGSKILENFVAPYNATAITKLNAQRAILIGKTNLDEFAMGSSTETSAFGVTRNPWNTDHVPGGSSGGSAVAVSAGTGLGALGTDTGGSVRQPASFCGVTGIKPTYGRISRYGVVAYASSFDQVGPLARTAEDCAILLNALCGHDPLDSTASREPVPDFVAALNRPLAGLKIGIPNELMSDGIDPDVIAAIEQACQTLTDMGIQVSRFDMPALSYALPIYYILAPAEASSNLSRYDGVRFGYRDHAADTLTDMYTQTRSQGFGPEVIRRIILGTYVLSAGYYDAYYAKAQKARTWIRQAFTEKFQEFDMILTPTSPFPAFKIGGITEPLQMYKADICTITLNLAGLPGISIPAGFSKTVLPIGMQLIGRHFDEASLLAAAHQFQQITDWHTKTPDLGALL